MITAALLIALLAAYYFGPKVGGVFGGSVFVLMLLALTRPSYALPAYSIIAIVTFGIAFAGPRVQKDKLDVISLVAKIWRQGRKIYKAAVFKLRK